MAKSDKTKEPAIQTSAEVTEIKVQQVAERTKAVDDLVLDCIKRQRSSNVTLVAAMLGASQSGINSAAAFFLKRQDFNYLASLAIAEGFSDSVMNDIAADVYSNSRFENHQVMDELTKSQSIVNGMIWTYIRRLNITALRKIVKYRKGNEELKPDEIIALMKRACEQGNILCAQRGAELRKRELTTKEIIALREAQERE